MNAHERLNEIEEVMPLLSSWPRICTEIQYRIDILTERLVASNDEGARGAIKELRQLIDLPITLQQEREWLAAALSEESDAAQ